MSTLHSLPVEGCPYLHPPDFSTRIVNAAVTLSGLRNSACSDFLEKSPLDCCACVVSGCWRSHRMSGLLTYHWSFHSWTRSQSLESRFPVRFMTAASIIAVVLVKLWALTGSARLLASKWTCSTSFACLERCYLQNVCLRWPYLWKKLVE